MAKESESSAADIVFTALSPALIMLMVGSLVFFLITVLPVGDYKERLLYTSFFFVFGAVLVARIAIQFDAGRASMYGLGLGIATFIAMASYVDYPPGTGLRSVGWLVDLGLMALIWWSAHKLTWDCTHVDENRDASGRGLLAASGLAQSDAKEEEPRAPEPEATAEEPKPKKKGKKKKGPPPPSTFGAWTTRWWSHHEKQKTKPHTPGVWVLYFSLAALPLFAVGQSLIPAEDAGRRWATFLQMAVYVGSGLGLLVTTSLLGLRRYLKQRKAKMSGSLTAGWLGLGGILIAVFLVVGAFLPRPYSEVPWFGLPQSGKMQRDASDYAQLRDSAGKGEGADGDQSEKGNGKASGKGGEPGGSKGEKGSGKGDKGKGGNSTSRDSKGSGSENKSDDSKDGRNNDDDSKPDENKEDRGGPNGKTDREGREAQGKNSRGNNSGRTPETKLGAAVQKIAGFLKWIVIVIVVFLILVAIVLAVLRYLAPFTEWARKLLDALRDWWANLFGRKKIANREEAVEPVLLGPVRPPPFSQYSNPFADGSGERREPAELVAYTFEALDAWAWDHGHGRQAAETPLEFTLRLGIEFPDFDKNLRKMGSLYARMAYAEGELPTQTASFLEQFWDQMIHGVDTMAVEV